MYNYIHYLNDIHGSIPLPYFTCGVKGCSVRYCWPFVVHLCLSTLSTGMPYVIALCNVIKTFILCSGLLWFIEGGVVKLLCRRHTTWGPLACNYSGVLTWLLLPLTASVLAETACLCLFVAMSDPAVRTGWGCQAELHQATQCVYVHNPTAWPHTWVLTW